MNPEVPLVEQPVDTNSVAIPDSQTDEMLPQEQPAIETPATNPVVTISMQQAQNALELIAHNSKRSLADALKAQNQELTESLYAIFKNSSNLLETLANTSDISTIPDIEQQISDLQSDLIEDIKLLDDTSNNAQSQ